MILDPIQRRFGHGAARLPLGRPVGGVSLSELARRPVAREAYAAVLPPLICVGVAFMLALTGQLEPQKLPSVTSLAIQEASPIAIELWSESVSKENIPIASPREIPAPVEVVKVRKIDEINPIAVTDPSTPAFDSAMFAMRPLAEQKADAVFAPKRGNGPRPSTLPSRPQPRLEFAGFRKPTPSRLDLADKIASSHRPEPARPHAVSEAGGGESLPAWSLASKRRAFLATLQTSAPPQASMFTRAAPRPPVAAASSRNAAVAESVRDEFARIGLATGWHEVPLDELPDCQPPGRQDLLKKRILLAAPFERECSNQDGSYRFIETRNLGAFLMWSRPNPDRPAGRQRARNVCDVLERALRCLDQSSIEESSAQ